MKVQAMARMVLGVVALMLTSFTPTRVGTAYALILEPLNAQNQDDNEDHETARDAHREGKLVPYGRIRTAVQEQFTGRVVYQSLSPGEEGGWVYELKVLKDDGHVLMVFVDASSGEVLWTKGKN